MRGQLAYDNPDVVKYLHDSFKFLQDHVRSFLQVLVRSFLQDHVRSFLQDLVRFWVQNQA